MMPSPPAALLLRFDSAGDAAVGVEAAVTEAGAAAAAFPLLLGALSNDLTLLVNVFARTSPPPRGVAPLKDAMCCLAAAPAGVSPLGGAAITGSIGALVDEPQPMARSSEMR